MSILFPVFPLYLERLGADKTLVGMVMGSFAIGVMATRFPAGVVIQKTSRKISMVTGSLIFLITLPLYITIKNPYFFLPLRIINGSGLALYSTAAITFVVDIAPSRNRSKILGYYGIASTLASVIGPPIGHYLFTRFTMKPVFICSTLFSLLALTISLLLPKKDVQENQNNDKILQDNNYSAVFQNQAVVLSTLSLASLTLCYGVIISFLPQLLNTKATDLNAGTFYLIMSLAIIMTRLLLGWLGDRYQKPLVMGSSLLIYGASMVLLSWGSSYPTLFIAAIFLGLGFGNFMPSTSGYVAENIPAYNRSRAYGFYLMAFDVGIFIGGTLFGFLTRFFGLVNVFWLCSIPAFIMGGYLILSASFSYLAHRR